MYSAIFAATVFLAVYALMITERFNRTVLALTGAGLLLVTDVLEPDEVLKRHIEWNTMLLLIGMMILVGITRESGVFEYAAVKIAKCVIGHPIGILLGLSVATAVFSAFLDNVTTVLLIAPVTLTICRMLKLDSAPFLIAEILSSNVGGAATLIGDPPNIMIGTANPHLTFNAFLVNLGPVVLFILAFTLTLLAFGYRRRLIVGPERVKKLMNLDEHKLIRDRKRLVLSLFVLFLTLLGFVLHPVIHLEPFVIAMSGATFLMLIGLKKEEVEKALDFVEWETIFFFAGLFALVGGLKETGILHRLAEWLVEATQGHPKWTAFLILWGSGTASAFLDNIPFVATMIPLIREMASLTGLPADSPTINTLWWSLALGACLGGNGTLIGASANVIVSGIAKRKGKGIGYFEYLKTGAPLTILSLLVTQLYLWWRFGDFLR
jgi:Na+/H+ antiporter NhaD/arsenite permease-like protein